MNLQKFFFLFFLLFYFRFRANTQNSDRATNFRKNIAPWREDSRVCGSEPVIEFVELTGDLWM